MLSSRICSVRCPYFIVNKTMKSYCRMLCTDLKEQICVAFMIFFPIYQLMAPVDSDIDLNK